MPGDLVDVQARDAATAAVLSRHRDGLLAALDEDGFRVPVPAVPDLDGFQRIPVPPDRTTMVDLVVPADAMPVIATWERCGDTGAAIGTVHLLTDPDRPVMLAIVDARHRYGVCLGVIAPLSDAPSADGSRLDGSQLAPLRPRIGVLYKDRRAVITGVDEYATGMLGWPPSQMIGVRSLEFIHPDDHQRAVANWMEMLSHQQPKRIRLRHRRQDGVWLWVEAENTVVGAGEDGDLLVETRLSDVSDEMAFHEEVRRREQLFRRLAESLPTGVLQVDRDGSIVYANARLAAILGIESAATLTEQLASLDDQDRVRLQTAVASALTEGTDLELEVELRLPGTGEPRRCTATVVSLTCSEGGSGALVSIHDITDSARMREELQARATYDTLTGCLNRGSVLAALGQALSRGHDQHTAVIYIDLDRFKHVNDTLGHAAGDELLVHIAARLRSVLRDHDQVGRLGGDEFLVICQHLDHPNEVAAIADRIHTLLHTPVTLAAGTVTPGASIGVAVGENGSSCEDLVARADTAMYQSKRHARGRVIVADNPATEDPPHTGGPAPDTEAPSPAPEPTSHTPPRPPLPLPRPTPARVHRSR
jgi:diguanylate cyclase (GGDEF)-like protein/PAS domain S-box-containing protein